MESNLYLLKHIYAKPFMRYDAIVLRDVKDQFNILYGELCILRRKVFTLTGFFQGLQADNWKSLCEAVSEKLVKKFNNMMKELIQILFEVANTVMQEFATDPEK